MLHSHSNTYKVSDKSHEDGHTLDSVKREIGAIPIRSRRCEGRVQKQYATGTTGKVLLDVEAQVRRPALYLVLKNHEELVGYRFTMCGNTILPAF